MGDDQGQGAGQQLALLDLSAGDLLSRFGAGAATPGSGSAAALMSLLASSLICAVAKMTVAKGKEAAAKAQAEVIVNLLENRISPRLKVLFEEDSRVFQAVIDARIRRDNPALVTQKRQNAAQATDGLREATNILFEIVDLSFQAFENGMSIWSIGFRPAMGDAGAGISASLAAITTCLLVANVNLRTARSSWSRDAKKKCDDIQVRMLRAQERVLQLVQQSSDKTAENLAEALPLPVN
ncbi:cyclodeaminase/cyclohydrolase family protein [Sphingomonas alpina]|uniref:Cyclodeaminase/cyclohydrolase family protein n=1 Tax=Sphingomonas alpina TaxID=653931 RepID=A0A7H0LKC3_9SPHN|nr:cyclodeaminase/cyclohydrolase family protein [Sphingomonas alpina]QNQ10126.1 cyclodeaminase/cyclohydrolase family protein [Sphingomonas alpina]